MPVRQITVRDPAHVVAVHRQRTGRGDPGIQLPEATRRRISGVGERSLAAPLGLPVQLFKSRLRHIDLAADFQEPRIALAQKPQRDRTDRPEILRHVLADHPVPARRAPHEEAILVIHTDRQSIKLWLRGVLDIRNPQALPHPLVPGRYLLIAEGVVQGQHGHLMNDLGKRLEGSPAHPLRRRVRRDQVGVGLLQLLELPEQAVVLGVGDGGIIEHIIAVVVVIDLLAQLRDALLDVYRRRHAHGRPLQREWPFG